jgi:trehalose 6-phosphate synthase
MPDIDRHLDGRTLILLSNREPYEHIRRPDGIEVKQPAGGLVSALDPTMRRTSGVWVAWGSGSADRDVTDDHDRVAVPPPPDGPGYTLRRVWLDEHDVEGYYLGFANSSLWPLCHLLIQHFEFRSDDWERYRTINDRFAAAVVDEARRAPHRPVVWIQDYHFALVAERLRQEIPDLFVHQFWHIPFPPPDILRLLPIGVIQTLLRGMLGNDLVEFQTERNAASFLRCVDEFLPSAIVDADTLEVHIDGVKKGDRVLLVDDLLATGGTMKAACDLIEGIGGKVIGCSFVVELTALGGRQKLGAHKIMSVLQVP